MRMRSNVRELVKMADGSNEIVLVKKKNAKSIVWDYFGLEAEEDGTVSKQNESRPVCRKCYKRILCKGGNTSNLFSHLRDKHPVLFKEASKGKGTVATSSSREGDATTSGPTTRSQGTLSETIKRRQPYLTDSPKAQEINKAVAYYLAKDMQPYYTVERPGFKNLVSKLNPCYKLPSRKYFSQQEIPRLYNTVKGSIMAKLGEIEYYSATTDLWTSRATHPYLSYTVHFITRNWEMNSFCLESIPLFEDHTGANISESITDIMANWQLPPDKLVTTTTDNGSNFVAAFNSKGWMRLSCFGHCLDLAIQNSTRYNSVFMNSLLDKCTLLDPRFKADFVKDKDLVLSNLEYEIMECSNLDKLAPVHPVDSSDDQPSISEPPVKKAKGLTAVLNHILPKVQPQRETLTLAQHCEREIHSYLEQPVIDSDHNPLHWWRDQNKNFPLLSKIAKKYLCILYDRHQATTMNHVPTQCTIIVILLLIIPIVTGACKCKYSI